VTIAGARSWRAPATAAAAKVRNSRRCIRSR